VAGRGRQRQERAASACGGPQHLGFDVEAVLESSEAAADRFPPTAIFVLPLTPEVFLHILFPFFFTSGEL
jgi:hypothetical protein